MRIAIYMTDEEARRSLIEQLGRAMVLAQQSFLLSGYRRLDDLIYEIQDGMGVDAVLFGVSDGKDTPKRMARLRRAGFEGQIILVSTDASYAVDGYDWGADGYWLLPMESAVLAERLDGLARSLCDGCLSVRSHRALVRIPFDNIIYAESSNSKCIIHRCNDEDVVIYCRLDDLAAELTDERFLRCHQSYLINMDHVIGAGKEFVMTGQGIASIRQRELKHIRDQYAAYYQRHRARIECGRRRAYARDIRRI